MILGSSVCLSAINVYEGFDYPDGVLGTQGGGTGWMASAGWGGFPRGNGINMGVAGTSAMVVEASTMGAPLDYGFELSGRHVNGTQGFNWAFRELAETNRIDMDAEQTIYFSYLFNMLNISDSGASYAELLFINADRLDLFRVGVQVRSSVPTIAAGDNTLWASGTREVQAVTDYLLVGRLVTGPTEDIISIQLYASDELIGGEPEVWEVEAVRDIRFAQVDRIGLLSGGLSDGVDHTTVYAELRFGSTFAEVTGVAAEPGDDLWAGYPVLNEQGEVDTGDFLGELNILLAPWIWSQDWARFLYIEEAGVTETGGWVYFPR